tara:strand:+ start:1141 stop:1848 length:708 start_codon:yes stop_codon:yes gene_type:complete
MNKQQIKSTKNYNLFTKIIGNRHLDAKNVKRIKESVEAIGLQTPIMVNYKHGIIDGQHRLQVAKELEIPIDYYVVSNFKEENIHDLQISKKWTAFDFAQRNSATGNKQCIEALEICNDWHIESKKKFSKTNILTLLLAGLQNNILTRLKENEFESDVSRACRIYNCIKILSTNKNEKFNSYSANISRILKTLDHEFKGLDYKIIDKINRKHYLEHYSNAKDQTRYLTDLYNKYDK